METVKPKIYIASKFHSRSRLMPIRFKLNQLGFQVLSTWMIADPDVDPSALNDSLGDNLEQNQSMAYRDHREVEECDIFVIDTNDQSATGGREVELGYAQHANKPCYRVGPIRNVFHSLTIGFNNWDELMSHLGRTYGLSDK